MKNVNFCCLGCGCLCCAVPSIRIIQPIQIITPISCEHWVFFNPHKTPSLCCSQTQNQQSPFHNQNLSSPSSLPNNAEIDSKSPSSSRNAIQSSRSPVAQSFKMPMLYCSQIATHRNCFLARRVVGQSACRSRLLSSSHCVRPASQHAVLVLVCGCIAISAARAWGRSIERIGTATGWNRVGWKGWTIDGCLSL